MHRIDEAKSVGSQRRQVGVIGGKDNLEANFNNCAVLIKLRTCGIPEVLQLLCTATLYPTLNRRFHTRHPLT